MTEYRVKIENVRATLWPVSRKEGSAILSLKL